MNWCSKKNYNPLWVFILITLLYSNLGYAGDHPRGELLLDGSGNMYGAQVEEDGVRINAPQKTYESENQWSKVGQSFDGNKGISFKTSSFITGTNDDLSCISSVTDEVQTVDAGSEYKTTSFQLSLHAGERRLKEIKVRSSSITTWGRDINLWICSLCKWLYKRPVQTTCGHRFCYECLKDYDESFDTVQCDSAGGEKHKPYYDPGMKSYYVSSRNLPCPYCHEVITGRKSNCVEVYPDKAVSIEINEDKSILVECPYCEKETFLLKETLYADGALNRHIMDACPKVEMCCPFFSGGCTFKYQREEKSSIDSHIRECGFRLTACEYCRHQTQVRKKTEHLDECDHYPVKIEMKSDLLVDRKSLKILTGKERIAEMDLAGVMALMVSRMAELETTVKEALQKTAEYDEKNKWLVSRVQSLESTLPTDSGGMKKLLCSLARRELAFDIRFFDERHRYFKSGKAENPEMLGGMTLAPYFDVKDEQEKTDYSSNGYYRQRSMVQVYYFGVEYFPDVTFAGEQQLSRINVLLECPSKKRMIPCGCVDLSHANDKSHYLKQSNRHPSNGSVTMAKLNEYFQNEQYIKVVLDIP